MSASYEGFCRIWEVSTGACRRTIHMDDQNSPVVHVSFTPNGKYLLMATLDSTLRLWDAALNKCAKKYRGEPCPAQARVARAACAWARDWPETRLGRTCSAVCKVLINVLATYPVFSSCAAPCHRAVLHPCTFHCTCLMAPVCAALLLAGIYRQRQDVYAGISMKQLAHYSHQM